MTEQSLLLVKPDGHASPERLAFLGQCTADHGLEVVLRVEHLLTFDEMIDLWPKFETAKYLVSRDINWRYMSSGPCELVVVAGPDAVGAVDRVKKAVRAEFGAGMFCNTVHAPTGPEEAAKAVERAVSLVTGAPYERHRDEGANEGVWGRLAAADRDELRAAIAAVWDRQQRLGWEGIRHVPVGERDAEATVVLRGGDDQSIDFGMSAVAHLWPQWSIEEVLVAYLEADSFGRSPLARCSSAEAHARADALVALGMLAEVVPTDAGPADG